MLEGELESLHETHLVAWAHFPEVECGIVDYESRPLPPAVPKNALARHHCTKNGRPFS